MKLIAQDGNLSEGVLSEDDSQIFVAGPLVREGVFNGALQEYEDLAKDAPGLVGIKYIRGEHPTDNDGNLRPISPEDPVIGEVVDARPVKDKKLIWGTWRLNKKLLTETELESIKAGKPLTSSPGFYCQDEELKEPNIYIPTGDIYSRIEKGPRRWDHVASPKIPACKRCGPNHAQSQIGGKQMVEKEDPGGLKEPDFEIDHRRFIVQGIWSDEELKDMISKTLALDSMMVDKKTAMEKLLVQILAGLDAAPIRIQAEEKMDKEAMKLLAQSEEFKEVIGAVAAEKAAEAIKGPMEKLATAETTIAEQKAKIDALEADKVARDEEQKKSLAEQAAAKLEALKAEFKSWLKPGKEADADALFEKAKDNIFEFRFRFPDNFVAQSQQSTKFSPAGSTTAPGGGSEDKPATITREDGIIVQAESGAIDWDAMKIKSPDKLIEELGLIKKTNGGV